jgi:hypothetical protein
MAAPEAMKAQAEIEKQNMERVSIFPQRDELHAMLY